MSSCRSRSGGSSISTVLMPVKKVLTEHVLVGQTLRREVGGADQADIDGLGLVGADRRHLAPLDGGEELALQVQRHVADLVEEERAAGSGAQQADPILPAHP